MALLLPKPEKRGPKPRRRIARHRRPQRERKTPIAKLKRIADGLWRAAILKRDGYRCRFCHKTQEELAREGLSLQGAHGFRRRTYGRVRWDLINGFALCSRDHTYFTYRETEWTIWMQSQLGTETLERLLAESRLHVLINRTFLEAKIAALRPEAGPSAS